MSVTTIPIPEQPGWLELPSIGPEDAPHIEEEEEGYWVYYGKRTTKRFFWFWRRGRKASFAVAFQTYDEAESHARIPDDYFIWNGEPPVRETLQKMLSDAERNGDLGVILYNFEPSLSRLMEVKRWYVGEALHEQTPEQPLAQP